MIQKREISVATSQKKSDYMPASMGQRFHASFNSVLKTPFTLRAKRRRHHK